MSFSLFPEQFVLEISPYIIPEKHLVLSLKELENTMVKID